jgi:hypothetical protein
VSLRVAFDGDGVRADFTTAYREAEARLFGPVKTETAGQCEDEGGPCAAADSARRDVRHTNRKRAAVWEAIRSTPDFWVGLQPIDPNAVRQLYTLMLEHRWEVFFLTQRLETLGDTVQRQTQRWLHEQGFDMPSVIVTSGSRGASVGPLCLHYYVGDSATNCVDLASNSRAHSILVVSDEDETTLANTRRMGIGTARNIEAALVILDSASAAQSQPHVLQHLARLVGWK